MICPKCHKEVEMLKYTTLGTMCRECDQDSTHEIDAAFSSNPHIPPALDKIMAAMALMVAPDTKGSPREAFESCKPYFDECIVTPENGGKVYVFNFTQEVGGQIVPKMLARYVRRLDDGLDPTKLTKQQVDYLVAMAKAMPAVQFHLQ